MKKLILSLMAAALAGALVSAHAQPVPPGEGGPGGGPGGPDQGGPPEMGGGPGGGPDTNGGNSAASATSQVTAPTVILPAQKSAAPSEEIESQFVPPTQTGTNANDLTLDFKGAPLDMVLNYLSDAAGFVIIQDTRVTGTVTVTGKHLTRDEAVNLLNAVLNRNNYAAIRDGRTLTIVDKNDAKTREIPVKNGNNPDQIPKNAEIVTQIIPIRFVEARQLVSDLSSFVSPQATVVANEAGNSIVITDTQANIHHLAEIIKAVDDSAEAETEIRVFRLEHANPSDVATELSSVFPSSTSGSSSQSPIRFGGGFPGGGGPGGFFQRMAAAASSTGNSSSDRIKKATQVNAVADARISAVIVTAPKDMMDQIASMMKDLDVASDRDQDVYVFQMKNGDSQAAALVLQNMFQTSSSRSSSSSSSQSSALATRQQNNATTTSTTSSSSGSTLGTSSRTSTGGGF